jgi:hypothetical protein
VTVAAGLLSLALGLAYSGLGVITAYELSRHSSSRGFSFFGAGFLLMAATCGPHHLAHAEHLLIGGAERASAPLLASLVLGTPAGVIFVLLRVEAAFGGRGDRLIAGTPLWLAAVPVVMLAAAGAILFKGLEYTGDHGFNLPGVAPNVVLFVNYLLVGIFTVRTQFSRRPVLGGWSLSGVAMGGVFSTCAVTHLVASLTTAPDIHTLTLDNLGVPASIFFLYVVHRLHRDSLRDWNRAPLVGRAAPLGRRSPWAAADESA